MKNSGHKLKGGRGEGGGGVEGEGGGEQGGGGRERGGRRGGTTLPFSENQKKCPDFGRKKMSWLCPSLG